MKDPVHGPGGMRVIKEFDERIRRAPAGARLSQQERFTRMHLDNAGKTVSELKAVLHHLGHYDGAHDETFDAALAQAIEDFQNAHGLEPADGIFGPSCFYKLAEIAQKQG